MPEAKELLELLQQIAEAWRSTADTAPQKRDLTQRFQQALSDLHATGWDSALGWRNEISDELMPERYLARRAELIDSLENRLAHLSTGWRRTKDHPEERAHYLEGYTETIEELFRIGHWSGEPDAESQLPDAQMPQVYKDYWRPKGGGASTAG